MTTDQKTGTEKVDIPDVLPVLPLRNTVVFPLAVAPLLVGQERSIKLVDEAMRTNRLVALVTQRRAEIQPAGPDDLYRVGTVGTIHQLLRGSDGTLRLIIQGIERVRIVDFVRTEPYLVARIEKSPEVEAEEGMEIEALVRTLRDLFKRVVGMIADLPEDLAAAAETLSEPRQLVYLVASSLPFPVEARQEVLESDPIPSKLRRLIELVQHELAVRELGARITSQTREQMDKAQRDYFLREQMKAIQKELGEEGPEQAEAAELRRRMGEVPLSEEARKEAERELVRLEQIPPASPEHGIIRTYLDWLLSLPWEKHTGAPIDVARARAVLDEDHYDLEKIKDRILEHLAVKKLRDERQPKPVTSAAGEAGRVEEETRREPILCFVGPPGVGKTSLGQSIARAMGRKFIRISLGGVHDEAEIRGHRRTYIGALPGRIVQALRRADASDPVFMLDEVDKLGVGFHGDPSAALLEVLDPAQNNKFVDTYLGVPFD
ncbi:MAG TPA: LON peptidase substrate-binding domain-containing protein, partial [Nitrospiria bacterium]|nr:LON peptidase substrate-binding domain-containing protein [Nitrospiria bacterium]